MAKRATNQLATTEQGGSTARLIWAVDQNLAPLNGGNNDKNKQLREGARLTIPDYDYFNSKFKVSISETNPDEEKYGKIETGLYMSVNPVAYLICDVELANSDSSKILSECDEFWNRPDLKDDAVRYALSNLVHNLAKNFVICANIVKPGSIRTLRGYFHSDEQRFDISTFNSNVNRGAQIEESKSIRLFRELPFADVWKWYAGLMGVFTGKPSNEVEVAVCNFISLFDENNDLSGARDLIWSFAGLESLLAESESGIVSQLRQKLIAIFGNQVDIKDFDKTIKDMYQVRSNIIHGKTRDIPTLQGHFLQRKKESIRQNQHDAADFAMYILTSLLQYCCQNGLNNIKFKTVTI